MNKKKLKITEYEKLLFPIIENGIQKLIASIILYETKIAYTSSYFLVVIAQEELAKLILIPIAKEIGGLDDLLRNRKDGFFNHRVKQKLFSTYGFFERKWEGIEDKKQNCLYTTKDDKGGIKHCSISKEECYKEIKNAIWVYQYQMKVISNENIFTKDFKKILLFMTKLLGGCIKDKIPQLIEDFKRDADRAAEDLKKNKNKTKDKFLESLFKNPYRMIEIIKHGLGPKYKQFLSEIKNKSFQEMVQHLGKKLNEIDSKN